jgi:ABC-2 type transport system permease protein
MSTTAPGRWRRVAGLVRKETLQVLRDPSSLLMAGVLPVLLLFVFGFGVTLDLRRIPVGVVIERATPEAYSFLLSFRNSRYFDARLARNRAEVEGDLVSGRLKGVVVLAQDFAERLGRGETAPVQVIVDGSDPNTAGLVQFYVQGLWANWVEQESLSRADLAARPEASQLVTAEPRYWFNPALASRDYILPGAVAIILTVIGTLLTALVVAREWERGTMEALMTTPVGRPEFLLGKLAPYFVLGQLAIALSVAVAVFGFGAPFRGSVISLLAVCSAYLAAMLSLGLLISTVTKNQFAASQAALISAFLPAFELSGFIFEIDSMPAPIRLLTHVLPARYFVSSLQTVFLAGDIPEVLVPNTLILLAFAAALFAVLVLRTHMRLE